MGGGGGGGGGSGNGAGNGNGSGDGNGDGSGDGANGDGSGAGSCGQGSGGSCTNCRSGTSAGDPVDALTGEVFTLPKTDLFLPGPFDLRVDRTYSSFATKRDVGLGWGWTHSLAWQGELHRDHILIHNGLGQTVRFPRLARPGESASLQGWALLRTRNRYVLRAGDEFMHVFAPEREQKHLLTLRAIELRKRGVVTLTHHRGRVASVTDAAGRVIHFTRDAAGRITALRVPSPDGQELVAARYGYDGAGNLSEAIDADGRRWEYGYDEHHRLVSMTIPGTDGAPGIRHRYVYDLEGRCVETWGERADGLAEPAIDTSVTLLADGRTKAKGFLHARIDFLDEGYVEVSDSVRVQRFFAGPGARPSKAVNGRGQVTSREFDAEGNVVRHVDANQAVWEYAYDELGLVVSSVDPEGRRTRFVRDAEGRVLRAEDAAGRVYEFGRTPDGEVAWARGPKGGMTTYRHDARGLFVEKVAADGGRTSYERDTHGNVVRTTLPNGGVHTASYDHWGRILTETFPDGRSFRYLHSASGRLLETHDSIGRVRSRAYDALGQVISETEPNGATWRYRFVGAGWLAETTDPLGLVARARYNPEGWLLSLENGSGERTEYEHGLSGAVVGEKTFDGRRVRYLRDGRDYIVGIVDATGKTEIERNKVGQVVKITAPDGSERSFRHDARGALVEASTPGAKLRWKRDVDGEVIREDVEAGGRTHHVETARDIMGRRLAMSTSAGHTVEVKRDVLGLPAVLIADGREVERIERDAHGWPIKRALAAGGEIVDELDAAGRLRRRRVEELGGAVRSSAEPEYLGAQAGQVDKTYAYTAVNELASVTTSADGTVEYEYDLRRRLLKRQGRRVDESFGHDAAGNPHPAGEARSYAAGGRITHRASFDYDYDARGRVVAKHRRLDDGARETTRFHYDAWDLLRRVEAPDGTVVTMTYDAFARRIEKRVARRDERSGQERWVETTRYVWDRVAIVHELRTRAASTEPLVHTYLYEDSDATVPLAGRGFDGGSSWLHFVHELNGSAEEVVDGAGRLVARATHTAYGRWSWSGAEAARSLPFRFPGQLEDAETGLHDNRYRSYDPDAGRYLTPDPIGLDGGLELYAYGPNPVAWVDPMGWRHRMTVTAAPEGFEATHSRQVGGRPQYESGMHDCPGGPPASENLRSRARCHTEQKFAHDLMQSGRAFEGEQFQLTGQYPPCPNCHRALQHAADRSGANVDYEWPGPDGEMQRISYRPKTPPRGSGSQATQLVSEDGESGDYQMVPDPSRRNGYRYRDYGDASSTYSTLSGELPELDD